MDQAELESALQEEAHFALGCAVEAGEDLVAAGLDSFAAMQLIAFLEDTYRIEVPEERLPIENFQSCRVIAGWACPLIAGDS